MSKKKGIVSLILTVAVLVFLAYTAVIGIGPTQTGAAKNIKLGLDLEGGVSITYQVKGDKPSSEDMSDTIYKLQKRVEQYSTEASVYQEGDDRISIEIPGVQNADEVLNELGQPGTLYFIAQTDSEGNQNYSYVSSTGDTGTDWQLNKSIEELEADGSIVLTGNDVKNATAESRTDQDTNSQRQRRKPMRQEKVSESITTELSSVFRMYSLLFLMDRHRSLVWILLKRLNSWLLPFESVV